MRSRIKHCYERITLGYYKVVIGCILFFIVFIAIKGSKKLASRVIQYYKCKSLISVNKSLGINTLDRVRLIYPSIYLPHL